MTATAPSQPPIAAPPDAAPAWTRAEVRACDRIITYLRAGSGRSVIVLCAAPPEAALWSGCLEQLARRCRVIVPAMHDALPDGAWLADFLEGLGVREAAVLAACGGEEAAALAERLAPLDAVAGVVLVVAPREDGSVHSATRATVVPRALQPEAAIPTLCALLAGPATTADLPARDPAH